MLLITVSTCFNICTICEIESIDVFYFYVTSFVYRLQAMEYTGLLELGCQKGNLNGFNTCVKDNCFFVTQHFPTQTRKVGERRANCCVIILYTIQGNVMLMQLLMLPCKVKRFSQCIPDPHSNVKFNWCTLRKPWTLYIYMPCYTYLLSRCF